MFAILKSPAETNIPPRSLNVVFYAFYFPDEFVDCLNEAIVDVSLRGFLLRLAKIRFYA